MAFNNENRPFHFIIYGATGFTGKYCIEYMVKCLEKMGKTFDWAIAGRSSTKLITVKNDVANILGINLDEIPVIVADNSDENTLLEVCKKCNVLINCVGPYSLYGKAVIRACLKTKTHQVDITGETNYTGNLKLKYHKQAEEAGVIIVNCCGFATLPWEVGVNYLKDAIKPKVLNSLECYTSGILNDIYHQGTFDSFIQVLSNSSELFSVQNRFENEVFKKPIPKFEYPHRKRFIPFYSDDCNGWCVNMSPLWFNLQAVQYENYTQRNERPVQIDTYLVVPNILTLFAFIFVSLMVILFTRCSCGVRLLTNYARWFTFGFFTPEGPTRESAMKSSFQFTLKGNGWSSNNLTSKPPDVEAVALVKGPNAPYITTSICVIIAAITIQEEFGTETMPMRGGVMTPGVAFRSTRIVDRLTQNAVTISVK